MNVKSAPSITRVHTLHRIRTIVNYVAELRAEGVKEISDNEIANYLIKTRLSVPTTDKFRDQIGRRARDHLETSRYLGLLYRKKLNGRYSHYVSKWGKVLSQHNFNDECPGSIDEELIFTDRVCRLKMTNTSYMQSSSKYSNFRNRICLNILYILYCVDSGLDRNQIAYIVSEKNIDCILTKKKIDSLIYKVTTKTFHKKYLSKLSTTDKKNIHRDTDPFIDWMAQLSLVKKEDSIFISNRGKQVYELYSNTIPVWWDDFDYPEVYSALIILINYLLIKDQANLIKKLLIKNYETGLFKIKPRQFFKKNITIGLDKILKNKFLFDFSLIYDVPPQYWESVSEIIQNSIKRLKLKDITSSQLIDFTAFYYIDKLKSVFKHDRDKINKYQFNKFKLHFNIPAASIYAQFKSDYEATSYAFLKSFENEKFKVNKYQKQLSDFMLSKHWKHFANNNPDLIIVNDFIGLIECKSEGEWGSTLKYSKKIISEISLYNEFVSEIIRLGIIKNCKAIFSYEGIIENNYKKELNEMLINKCPYVYILSRKALQKALNDQPYRRLLRSFMEKENIKSLQPRIIEI